MRRRLPVLPICLFLRVGLDGLGWDAYEERFWGRLLLRFEYSYVGLPALDAQTYIAGPNLLGVALSALMRLPPKERARLKAEGLERIATSRENEVRKYLFAECFDNYFRLSESDRTEFDRLQAERFSEGKTMTTGWLEQGRVKGMRDMVRKMLDKKFGPLDPEVVLRLEALPVEKVEEIALALIDSKSLDELGLGTEQSS